MSRVREEVREFISRNFIVGEDDAVLSGSDSFLDSGLIDSMGVLELVDFLEESFGIEVLDDEMLPGNLDSIDNIVGYITKKLG